MIRSSILAATAITAVTLIPIQSKTVDKYKIWESLGQNGVIKQINASDIDYVKEKLKKCGINIEYIYWGNCPEIGRPDTKPQEPETEESEIPDTENQKPEGGSQETGSVPETDSTEETLPEGSDENIPEETLPEIPETEKPTESTKPERPSETVPESTKPERPTETVPETSEEETSGQEPVESDFAGQVVKLVNEERAKAGLSPLSINNNATAAALVRAKEIEVSFAHTRPDGSGFSTALTESGVKFRGAGENIAWGQKSPQQVMQAWMNSPGHRANILNAKYTSIGVGYYQNSSGVKYWTQLFIY